MRKIINGDGGCRFVTDTDYPHLGGNLDGADPGTLYPDDLFPWLVKKYSVKTVLDVGCGMGYALKEFRKLGCTAIGMEGLPDNAARCEDPCILHDLTRGPLIVRGIDMIWCCDVAEHIEKQYLENFLRTVTACRVLALTHGVEENASQGYHHVNNESNEYWIEKIVSTGMRYDAEATEEARRVGNHGWWPISGKIFLR